MAMLRFDPFRDLDRLTEQAWGRARGPVFPMNAYRRGDDLILEFEVPGVDTASVDITVEKNVLTVAAERRTSVHEDDEVLVSERASGHFTRQLRLGDGYDTDAITAAYEDGLLTVTLPTAAEVRPRKIVVEHAGRVADAPVAQEHAA
jgi:HSP20 family protein